MYKITMYLIASTLLLSGCAGGVTTTKTDPISGATTTTKETSIFESENLNEFYKFETKRLDNHMAVSTKKLDVIMEAGAMAQKNCATTVECMQASMITQMQADRVSTAPPPSGVTPPKTATDMFDKNLIPLVTTLGNLSVQFWGDNGDSSEHSQVTITNTGDGNVLMDSNGNNIGKYSFETSGESSSISGITFDVPVEYSTTYETSSQEGDTSYGFLQ